MRRDIEKDLLTWKEQPELKPLVLKGARQVGKTFVVEQFGKEHFEFFVQVNFELEPQYSECFRSLDPVKIIPMLEVLSRQHIKAGKTLLFLDEVQECPNALMALRYFKEKAPHLHVIAAGSLLEFCLNEPNFRMPVGRVQFLYLYPLSFREFLRASEETLLLKYLAHVDLKEGVSVAIHQAAMEKYREYMVVGGMPEVVSHFQRYRDYQQVEVLQQSIIEAYRNDFGKYDAKLKPVCLQALYRRVPGMVAQHFKYSHVDSDMLSRDLKPALNALLDAGLIHAVRSTSASGIPLNALVNEKKFKLLFLDVGLVRKASGVSVMQTLQTDLMLLNQGALTEQFVGQELLAYARRYQKSELYYWERSQPSSSAEVDYVLQHNTSIIPVEVKAGKTGRLRSLKIFMDEKDIKLGVRVSSSTLTLEGNVLSVPLYLLHELARLIDALRRE